MSCTAGAGGRAVQGVCLRPLACCDRGFESHRGHGCLSVVYVVCCGVEVSATSWSLVQMSPTDCGASLCVNKKPCERGRHSTHWPAVPEKINNNNNNNNMGCTRDVYEREKTLSTKGMNKVTVDNHESKCQFMLISRYIAGVSLKLESTI
jgi:hypothetical protein